jgi:hypothetical protein
VGKIDKHTLCCLHFDKSVTKDEIKNKWVGFGELSLDEGKFEKACKFGAKGSSGIYTDAFDVFTKPEWTIDFWVKYLDLSAANVDNVIFSNSNYNIANHPCDFSVSIYGGFIALLCYDTNGYTQFDGNNKLVSLPLNEFCHIAIVKQNTNLYIFKNGKQEYLANVKKQICVNNGKYAVLGDWHFLSGYVRYLIATIDEFRISDVARWTSDFTPPTTPYNKNFNLYLDENNAVWGVKNE